MHDPMSVAHELRYPWRKYPHSTNTFEKDYRESFLTIWHVDPEIGGSDDSCGWFTPPFPKVVKEICDSLAHDEARDPWFLKKAAESNDDMHEVYALVRAAFVIVSRCMVNRGAIRREVPLWKIDRWALEMTHSSIDNYRNSLCFKSGYHSNTYDHNLEAGRLNSVEEDKFWREQQARSFFSSIAGFVLRDRRWWFQKPRWHVWHWSLQVHSLQRFKRWAFSRCAGCGKRFTYGYSPVSGSWHGKGPQWFKSESNTFHSECIGPSVPESAMSGIEIGHS